MKNYHVSNAVAQIDKAITTVDHVAGQSDRWLFIALLIIGLLSIWLVVRYFMQHVGALQSEIVKVRENFETHLKSSNADMVAVITKNTAAFEAVMKKIEASPSG